MLGNIFVNIGECICLNWEIYLKIISFLLCNFSSSSFKLKFNLGLSILCSWWTLRQTHLGSVGCVLYPQRLTKFRLSSAQKSGNLSNVETFCILASFTLFVISSFATTGRCTILGATFPISTKTHLDLNNWVAYHWSAKKQAGLFSGIISTFSIALLLHISLLGESIVESLNWDAGEIAEKLQSLFFRKCNHWSISNSQFSLNPK